MAIAMDPPGVARQATPLDELLPALGRLDRRLALAVERARLVFGPEAASDRFRGLYITETETQALLSREPAAGAFHAADPDASADEDSTGSRGERSNDSRLAWLARAFTLAPFDVNALVVALAPKLDLRYERLYAFLQDDVTRRRPTIDLVLTLLCDSARDRADRRTHFSADAPLMRHRLLHVGIDGSPTTTSLLAEPLELDDQIVDFLLGHDVLDRRLANACRLEPVSGGFDIARPSALEDLTWRILRDTMRSAYLAGESLRLLFHGADGTGKLTAARALARAVSASLMVVDVERITTEPNAEALFAIALRAGWFQRAVTVVRDAALLTAEMRAMLDAHTGIVVLCATEPRALASGSGDAVVIAFGVPTSRHRSALWSDALGSNGVRTSRAAIEAAASRFRLTPRQIWSAAAHAVRTERWRAAAARAGHAADDELAAIAPARELSLAEDELFAAARAQCGIELETLAARVTPRHRWADLVLPDDTLQQLHEICERVAQRETVVESWGFGHRLARGGGVNALFSGPSGTGKTMAAEVMAGTLGVDLFRVDLAGVVSKYIGETEKNLDRVFTAAERANGIVFFDEADALFGKRSEVHDSHDRYANIEISYLLQKMEQFDGIAILATNLRGNLDDAFVRRLAFSVHFPFPDAPHRERIWRGIWPPDAPVDPDIDGALLARQFVLSGGHIKNIAVAAAFLAAERGGRIELRDIVHAARREYQKLGKALTDAELGSLGGGASAS